MTFDALPPALLVLVHLHLLGFEATNGSAYDENLFDTSLHGGGERVKAMEEITQFLVVKIEGTASRAKKILPTYPCTRPSDTLAFRNALTKYLESLKHSALHPDKNSNTADSTKDTIQSISAWWWKDVIVRKSLLEECYGERFLRLLLALSTHALLQRTTDKASFPSEDGIRRGQPSMMEQCNAYATALASFQSSRLSWESATVRLTRRQDDVTSLKSRLDGPTSSGVSQYDHLATEKLLAQRDSRIRDLLNGPSFGDDGEKALYELLDAAGLRISSREDDSTELVNSFAPDKSTITQAVIPAPCPPLPIAAAHHPKKLRNLSKPVLGPAPLASSGPSGSSVDIPLMSDRLSAESQLQRMLRDALAQAERDGDELTTRLQALKSTAALSEQNNDPHTTLCDLNLNLWQNRRSSKTRHKAAAESFTRLPSAEPRNVQERVDYIRASLTASLPPVPDPAARVRRSPPPTRLPQAKAQVGGSKLKSSATTNIPNIKPQVKPARPTTSNFLAKGRARRSSVLPARSRVISAGEAEVNSIVNTIMDMGSSSSSNEEGPVPPALPQTPQRKGKGKVTQGTPLSKLGPGTPFSTLRKPRLTFDMARREAEGARGVAALPRRSMAALWGSDSDEADSGESEEYEEGRSRTLGEILLTADTTHLGIADETFEEVED